LSQAVDLVIGQLVGGAWSSSHQESHIILWHLLYVVVIDILRLEYELTPNGAVLILWRLDREEVWIGWWLRKV